RHFETFHEIQQPTYASKLFPGQGLFLALGQAALGNPWWGVVLSVAGMCALTTWCVLGFLSSGWALFGGLLLAAQFATTHYWATTYWGGAVAAMGGCLALGATGRMLRAPGPAAGALFGLGASLLAVSRPYDGGVTCLLRLAWLLLAALRRGRGALRTLCLKSAWSMALIGGCGLAGLLVYNHAVTGNAFRLPYIAYSERYEPNILLTAPGVPIPDANIPPEMRRYNREWSIPAAVLESTLPGKAYGLLRRSDTLISMLNPTMVLGLCATVPALPALAAIRPLVVILGLGILSTYISAWINQHYLAPLLPVATVMCLTALRLLRCLRLRGRPVGLALVRLLPAVVVALGIWDCAQYAARPQSDNYRKALVREGLRRELLTMGGEHLVVVSYAPDANVHAEWVYNAADIDASPIVWSRDLGPRENEALFAYFKDRRIWCATVGLSSISVKACPAGNTEATATR
ncbi:hypothetical protein, partial [Solidesulfovibrio sp.]|uniref:hypothetical protein n=1 Tax=Solidesulfovibrio sp. TaxID=2910990 RepID=UPI00262A1F9B